ncbi:Acyl-phosphate:glycerol-3-phosphate O-acyltransferase PlsY (EC 2.3.1.n3) [hydrothermal vent metagenome]|uniref:Acyl-phosphate:glycerol-3-phosphate O-acyltransferase PlsY n=1 Tax=hydrothermal vent metagenome TaxID=652676 RepID=A0A3B1BUM7_9ZZZZ
MEIIDYSLIACAYLFGSISAAIIVCRLMGLADPRTQGSGNPGATNVLRVGGKKAAAITLAGDFIKGLIPVLLAQWLGVSSLTLALVGLAAFLGHLYPVFFGFKGGKGVATLFGVLLGLHWGVGLATIGSWLFVAKVLKISSLAALVASPLALLYIWLLIPSQEFMFTTAIMTVLLYWRHRSNIQRLLQGEET